MKPNCQVARETTLITSFANYVLASPRPLAMPIGVYAGLELTGASLRDAVSDPQAQAEAVLALHARFATRVLLTHGPLRRGGGFRLRDPHERG